MDKMSALDFLRQHQPLPPDEELTESLLDTYDEVRIFFLQNPDPACVPLLLNSFGDGSGFGVYQLVEDTIKKFDLEVVLPHLIRALHSSHHGVKYWCAQIASDFPAAELIQPLSDLANGGDNEIQCFAVLALTFIRDPAVIPILRALDEHETDETIKETIREYMASLNANGTAM